MSANEWIAIGMIGGFLAMMMLGIPVAISLAVSGFVAGYLGFGDMLVITSYSIHYTKLYDW